MTESADNGAMCQSDAAYVLGALSPVDRRAFEDHLRECAGCRESVQRLAGMPGLLSLTSEDAVLETGPPVPDSLLPGLIGRARSARRHRGWVVGGLLAASIAVVVALAGMLALRTPDGDTAADSSVVASSALAGSSPVVSSPAAATLPMTPLLPGSMTASLELVDKKWGTAITVVCQYDEYADTTVTYDLTVVDTDGNLNPAGTWRAVPGVTAKVATATAIPRDRIAALEIRLADGEPIFRSGP